MQNHFKKYAKQVELYKNKLRMTYLSVAADIFLLLALYFPTYRSVRRHLCFDSGTENDFAGHIIFISPCYPPDKGTSM